MTIVFVIILPIIIMDFIQFYNVGTTVLDGDILLMLLVLDVVMFVGVLASNYIVFKKITLWHKQ
tara:strand:+ start:51 stop:242 length:192 start_codon:yes stop_codon:yes gene_type:complete